jgi:hypothetical protein
MATQRAVSVLSIKNEEMSSLYLSNATRGSGNNWRKDSVQLFILNPETGRLKRLNGPALTMIAIL